MVMYYKIFCFTIKIFVHENFVVFTGKHLCWSLYLINLQAFRHSFLKSIRERLLLPLARIHVTIFRLISNFRPILICYQRGFGIMYANQGSNIRHGVKVEPRTWNSGTRSKFKDRTRDTLRAPSKFEYGTPGPLSKFKNGTHILIFLHWRIRSSQVFGIQFGYSVFSVFPDLKDFQFIQKHKSTETNTKTKILPKQSYLAQVKP